MQLLRWIEMMMIVNITLSERGFIEKSTGWQVKLYPDK